MNKVLISALTLALTGCGANLADAPTETRSMTRASAASLSAVPLDAFAQFKIDVQAQVDADYFNGAVLYREAEKVAGGQNTLMVFRLDPRNFTVEEQKQRAQRASSQVPGTRAVILRGTADFPNSPIAYWGVVRDVAAHCGNTKVFIMVGCTMPDTANPAMPGYDVSLRNYVLAVNEAMNRVGPQHFPIRVYRESHAFKDGHHQSLVIRAEHGVLPKTEQAEWAKLMAQTAGGHHEINDLGGVRSPEAPTVLAERVEATVSGTQ